MEVVAFSVTSTLFLYVQLDTKIAASIKEAEAACNDGQAAECATAWDEVEELSAAAAHKKDAVCALLLCWVDCL